MGPCLGRLPGAEDNVYLHSSLLTDPGRPLYIADGDTVGIYSLHVGWAHLNSGEGQWQHLEVDGGTLTTDGPVYIGSAQYCSWDSTCGQGFGVVRLRSGTWNANHMLYVGFGKEVQAARGPSCGILDVLPGARLNAETLDTGTYGDGIVTNAGFISASYINFCPYGGIKDCVEHATLVMRGGTNYAATCDSSAIDFMSLGQRRSTCSAVLRGWGTFDRGGNTAKDKGNIRMSMLGQVIADGEGEERDLNLGWFQTVNYGGTSDANWNGTNGFFAVNKGRLIMPHRKEVYASSLAVDESCHDNSTGLSYDNPSKLINTVHFKGNMSGSYKWGSFFWAYLYAPDRSDIPDLSPVAPQHPRRGKWLSVWRLGFFSQLTATPVAPTGQTYFDTMSFKFRYDHRRLHRGDRLMLYRYHETNKTWDLLTTIVHDPTSPYIEAKDVPHWNTSTENNWLAGWFAIKVDPERGLAVVVR